jgi:hypothetical protein
MNVAPKETSLKKLRLHLPDCTPLRSIKMQKPNKLVCCIRFSFSCSCNVTFPSPSNSIPTKDQIAQGLWTLLGWLKK